ncbi:MAG: hypothetical protein WCZ86_00870 [Desulfurivibrionaceae bacterium]|jgi:hypothetical protein
MATTTAEEKTTSYQPVFPEQYPKECHRCKIPTACEKFVVEGGKADMCIFFCPKNPGMTAEGKPLYLGKVKERHSTRGQQK